MRNRYLMRKLREMYQNDLRLDVVQTTSLDYQSRSGLATSVTSPKAVQVMTELFQRSRCCQGLAGSFNNPPRRSAYEVWLGFCAGGIV